MNNFIKIILFAFAIFVSNRANANCANASLALNSITETSPGSNSWVVNLTFCADHGALITSVQTGNFEFTFVGSSAVTAFTPSITASNTGAAAYAGATAINKVTYTNAISWFHYLEASVGANYCYPVSFTVTGRPSNITLYGIEAADDLTGGSGCPISVAVPALGCSSTAAFGSAAAPTTPTPC